MSERPRAQGSSDMPPLEGNQFPGKKYSRRDIIFGGLKGVGALGIAATLGTDPGTLSDGAGAGIKYGPEIVLEVGQEPYRAVDTLNLWRTPELEFKKSPFLTARFEYSSDDEENVVIAFGDSNMVGSGGKNRDYSPVKLFTNGATERFGARVWSDVNIAHSGDTTRKVIEEQLLSPEAREAFSRASKCDVWINAGGNDLSAVVQNREEIEEVEELQEDLLTNPELLFKYGSRMMDNLESFRNNFSSLLFALSDVYGPKIRHLVIMSVPDFSRAPAITSQYIEDKAYKLPLDDARVRELVHNVSIRMNNEMFNAARDFHEKAGTKIIGIDTFNNSYFGDDQHLTVDALRAIADEAVGRIEMAV